MDNSKSNIDREIPINQDEEARIAEAAQDLVREGQKRVNELYEEGLQKVQEAQDQVAEYSKDLAEKVREKPLTALLVAAGAGFILSALFKK